MTGPLLKHDRRPLEGAGAETVHRIAAEIGCEAMLRAHLRYGHWLSADRAAAEMRRLGMVPRHARA
jgi:pentatricopeptide repeat protein